MTFADGSIINGHTAAVTIGSAWYQDPYAVFVDAELLGISMALWFQRRIVKRRLAEMTFTADCLGVGVEVVHSQEEKTKRPPG